MDVRTLRWDGPHARRLAEAGDIGGLIRWARTQHRWRLEDLGAKVGYSASQLSRLERGLSPLNDVDMLRRFASVLGIPAPLLGLADQPISTPSGHGRGFAAMAGQPATTGPRVDPAAAGRKEEDPMLRRSAMALTLAVPAAFLARVDDALAAIPTGPALEVTNVATGLRRARSLFDVGQHAELVQMLPELLGAAHGAARSGHPHALATLSACYDVATETLAKIGRYDSSRITADRSTVYSDMSGSPLAQASSARMLSIVLRHQDDDPDNTARAAAVTVAAAGKVEATGLSTDQELAVFLQLLCSCSYTAAAAGDRGTALEMIRDADSAAARLRRPVRLTTGLITPATVGLYTVGTLWALGDCGAALSAGERLHPGRLPTAERRGRLHADMARAWWQWDRPQQTAAALLNAWGENPGEVRDRPAMREIVADLDARHPRVEGVQDLVTRIGRASLPQRA